MSDDAQAAATGDGPTIEDYYQEDRTFPPPPEFVARAELTDPGIYARAEADPEAFWAGIARDAITWDTDFHTTLEWNLPDAKWFVGGKLNVAVNCLDSHVDAGLGDRVAYHWEGEPGDTRTLTYRQLHREVCQFANALKALGVRLMTRTTAIGYYHQQQDFFTARPSVAPTSETQP